MTENSLLSVEEGLKLLKEKNITSSIQIFRRWLREGYIEGAYIESKKKGWKIPEISLLNFILSKKQEKYDLKQNRNGTYDEKNKPYIVNGHICGGYIRGTYMQAWDIPNESDIEIPLDKRRYKGYSNGYIDGYSKAYHEIQERDKRVIFQNPSIYETKIVIERENIREKAKELITYKVDKKYFLEYIDTVLFKNGKKKPKNKVYFNVFGNWVFLENTFDLCLIQDLNLDDSFSLETRIEETWLENAIKDWKKTYKRTKNNCEKNIKQD